MYYDMGWLWNTLQSISESINEWFGDIWTQATNISNTGQGIYMGLVAFGSQIWDALVKFAEIFGEWFKKAFKYIREGLENLGETLGAWIGDAFKTVGAAISWIANQIYNFGNWLYNSLKFGVNWIMNALTAAWEGIVNFFSGVSNALGTWWGTVTTTVNTWWTDLIKGFRNKIRDTIIADFTIMGAFKGMERFWSAQSVKDVGFGIMGLVASPIAGYFAGRIIDAVIPIPTTEVYPLIPTIGGFEYTPPLITIPTPTEPTKPTLPPESPPIYPYTPVYQFYNVIETHYDHKWIAVKDKTAEITTTYETAVA